MSAIFVKMPPQMRRADAPRDSPMAKPMKHGTGVIADGRNSQDADHEEQLHAHQQQADAHAGLRSGIAYSVLSGLPVRARRRRRASWRTVLMRMPNHATP